MDEKKIQPQKACRVSTHLDLFSGIGGFALASKWAGFKTIGFSEIDSFCCKVLEKNFPGIVNYGDIKKIDSIPSVDLLTVGLPCQPFSQAGSKRGVNDDRYLWQHVQRIISNSTPNWIIIENVCGIISLALDDILSDLARENYYWRAFVLPACAANAPHRRDRLWVVAYHNSIRSDEWEHNRQARYLQENFERHMAEIQSKWSQFKPDAWATYTARDWLNYNSRASRRNDGIPTKLDKDRIKALGNAIVPQVIYPILEFIENTYEQ